jgi:hypothetical protein
MKNLDAQIHERKKNWLEHLQSMPSEKAGKQLVYYQPTGRSDSEDKEKDGMIFEDGTGQQAQHMQMMISCFPFGRLSVRFSTHSPAILTEVSELFLSPPKKILKFHPIIHHTHHSQSSSYLT